MPNKARNPNDKRKYDLQQRTARFGGAIVEPARTFPQDPINNPLISQIVRAATDIGADYMGADGAESKKDFQHKISIRKKESKEIKRWLRMIAQANPNRRGDCQKLLQEAQELSLIFSSILLPKR